jgi:UDP-2-acetamido-2-deoxy-ribo-hexuluronate aminotransferase
VSLYGQPADMAGIQEVADKYGLKVIIDGAQSFGSTYKGKTDSNLGDISITSFFPAKPLGCYGDGGAVFTNRDDYAEIIKMMRVHGQNKRYQHKHIGMGGRLDTIQAAVLLAKLPYYDAEIKARQAVARKYTEGLEGVVQTPKLEARRASVWAQYTIRIKNREKLQESLKDSGVPTAIHYPSPVHMQECFKYLGLKEGEFPVSEIASKEVLSLPMNSFLKQVEVETIIDAIVNFQNQS